MIYTVYHTLYKIASIISKIYYFLSKCIKDAYKSKTLWEYRKIRSSLAFRKALLNLFSISETSAFLITDYARSTLPERRHLEQTYTWQGVPFTIAFTRFTFGFHVLLERLCEWDTLIPNVTPLPQNSHFAIIGCTSLNKLTDSIITDFNLKCKCFFVFFKKNFLLQF